MTKIEYNGGADFYVGLSTEAKPTAAVDKITEGAAVYERDTKTLKVFCGDDNADTPWDTVFTFD